MKKNICPVCEYELNFEPWEGGVPAHEMCPQCSIEFGYDDAAGGDENKRQEVYKKWRERWLKEGKKFSPLS